jgi:glutamate 5-kinase
MTARVRGRVMVDKGAASAIARRNASLLPKGITGAEGGFDIGDVIVVVAPDGKEIAKGVALYSQADIEKIRGLHSEKITGVLGYTNGSEVIHRSDMVFTDNAQ